MVDLFLVLAFTTLAFLAYTVSQNSIPETKAEIYVPYDEHIVSSVSGTNYTDNIGNRKPVVHMGFLEFQQAAQFNMEQNSKQYLSQIGEGRTGSGSFYQSDYKANNSLLVSQPV